MIKGMIQMREQMDTIDKRILELLAERLAMANKIAEEKQNARLPIVDKEREEQLEEMWKIKAKELGIKAKPVSKILKEVLDMSKEAQRKLIK